MIRRRDDPSLIITQTAHGWLAGQFAMYWGNEAFQFPALPQDVIMAAVNHDNGWTRWEQSPQLDCEHQPVDFLDMPVEAHVQLWHQGINGLALQNLYAALLVSMHGRVLIEGRLNSARQDTEADKQLLQIFSTEQRAWEADLINHRLKTQTYFAKGCQQDNLKANLRLLQVFDWFSLLLCMRELSPTVVKDVPGQTSDQRLAVELIPLGPHVLSLAPWPFKYSGFEVTVQAHQLPSPTFENEAEFQAAWRDAPIQPLVFKLQQM